MKPRPNGECCQFFAYRKQGDVFFDQFTSDEELGETKRGKVEAMSAE